MRLHHLTSVLALCLFLAAPALAQQELRSGGKGASTPRPVTSTVIDADHNGLDVNIVGGDVQISGADGAITDGTDSNLKATVKDYTNSNPLTTIIVDTNGDPASIGGGTQYTEDAASAANPVGTMVICRRRDTLTGSEVSADSDNIALNCTSKGEIYVKQTDALDTELPTAAAASDAYANPTAPSVLAHHMCWDGSTWLRQPRVSDTDAIGVSGNNCRVAAMSWLFNGTSWDRIRSAVNALNSTGTGLAAAQIIGQFDDTSPTAITENQFGNLRMSANRNLFGTIRDAAGNERGANVNASNELTTSANTELPAAATIADNTATPTVPGVASFNMVYDGSTWDFARASTAGAGNADSTTQRVVIAKDSAVCNAKDTLSAVISTASSGNVELVALTSAQTIYLCDFTIIAGGTVGVQLIYGTGTACATGETNLTGVLPLVVNSGWTHNYDGRIKTAEANALCIELSAAVQVDGVITYRKAATF